MSLDIVRRTFEKWGREDPMYAVLTDHARRNNRWDPAEFFATGTREIDHVMAYLRQHGQPVALGSVLDFGCGVGRLSQALATHFTQVIGIDIADSMIARAKELNQHGDRVSYRVNVTDDLAQLPSASLDAVYTNITLQHVPPDSAIRYVREFFRVLKPGGVALFQIPSGKAYAPGSLGALLYRVRRGYLRRAWKVVRGKAPYEMHYIPRADVEATIASCGARLIDVVAVSGRENYRYLALKA
jgi:SAM-dependent methyltransferase